MNNKLIVSKEKFEERTKENHPFLSDTYNMDLEFECGCGSSHLIDGHGHYSIMSSKKNIP